LKQVYDSGKTKLYCSIKVYDIRLYDANNYPCHDKGKYNNDGDAYPYGLGDSSYNDGYGYSYIPHMNEITKKVYFELKA